MSSPWAPRARTGACTRCACAAATRATPSQGPRNPVGSARGRPRGLAPIQELDAFQRSPWTGGYLQGIVDVPFLNLTPGTRTGIIHDEAFAAFCAAAAPVEEALAR